MCAQDVLPIAQQAIVGKNWIFATKVGLDGRFRCLPFVNCQKKFVDEYICGLGRTGTRRNLE